MTWTVYAHEDDPRYLSINDGTRGDVLLRTSEGSVDQASAAAFAEWVGTLTSAYEIAVRAFAQYATRTNEPPDEAIADFLDGFMQDARLQRKSSS